MEEFVKEASAWVERANKTNLKDPLAVRMLNDQIMQVKELLGSVGNASGPPAVGRRCP